MQSKTVGTFNALANPDLFPAPEEENNTEDHLDLAWLAGQRPGKTKAQRSANKRERQNKRNGRRQKRK